MSSMRSKYSHMKRLNNLSCMIYYYKNRLFKASLIVTGRFCDASDYKIDEIPESWYEILSILKIHIKGNVTHSQI